MPLKDILVLDLTQFLPGPFCTQILGDFGAEVVKIEGPAGDPSRVLGYKVNKESGPYLTLNRNKKSLVLNLKHKKGKQIFRDLAKKADVIIEGFRPGVTDRLGIGYEDIAKINPRIIYCSLSAYGQEGPFHERPCHDLNVIGLAGILGLTGLAGDRPIIPGTQIADLSSALMAALGIMLGLWSRNGTGKGQFIDIAMLDSVVPWLSIYLGEYLATKKVPTRGKMSLNGGHACYNVYATKDGKYMTLGIVEPSFWGTFCAETGKEYLIADQYAPEQRQREMIEVVQSVFLQKTQEEWITFWQNRDVPCEPVLDLDKALEHPQVRAREMAINIDHPTEGRIQQYGIPIKLSGTPGSIRNHAPALGENTFQVLSSIGYSAKEIEELRTEGIV